MESTPSRSSPASARLHWVARSPAQAATRPGSDRECCCMLHNPRRSISWARCSPAPRRSSRRIVYRIHCGPRLSHRVLPEAGECLPDPLRGNSRQPPRESGTRTCRISGLRSRCSVGSWSPTPCIRRAGGSARRSGMLAASRIQDFRTGDLPVAPSALRPARTP